jgi:hypothetical protein
MVLPAVAALKVKLQVAVAFVGLTVRVAGAQSCVAPWVNVTLPVGTTVPVGAVTVAVKVTAWFTAGEAGADPSAVSAATLFTVSVTVAGEATVKLVSPLYVATTTSAGTTKEEVMQVACWLAFTVTAGQSMLELPLIVKVTVPLGAVGLTELALTVAVKVTDVPTVAVDPSAGTKAIVAASGLTVCVAGPEVSPTLVSYVASPP